MRLGSRGLRRALLPSMQSHELVLLLAVVLLEFPLAVLLLAVVLLAGPLEGVSLRVSLSTLPESWSELFLVPLASTSDGKEGVAAAEAAAAGGLAGGSEGGMWSAGAEDLRRARREPCGSSASDEPSRTCMRLEPIC